MAQFDTIHVPKQRVPSGAGNKSGGAEVPISVQRREHVVSADTHEAFYPMQGNKVKKSHLGTWLWVLLAVIIIAAAVGGGLWYLEHDQQATIINTPTNNSLSSTVRSIASPNASPTAVASDNSAYTPPSDWKNYYKGQYLAISFYYPPTIKIDSKGEVAPVDAGNGVTKSSLSIMSTTVEDFTRKLSVSESVATISRYKGGDYPTLSQRLTALSAGKTEAVKATKTDTISKNGLSGYSFEYLDSDSTTETEVYIPIASKDYLQILVKGSNLYLDELIKSISF